MWKKQLGLQPLQKAFLLEIFGKFCPKDKVLGLGLPDLEHLLPSYKSPNSKRITKENLVSYLLCNQIWLDPPFANVVTQQKLFKNFGIGNSFYCFFILLRRWVLYWKRVFRRLFFSQIAKICNQKNQWDNLHIQNILGLLSPIQVWGIKSFCDYFIFFTFLFTNI